MSDFIPSIHGWQFENDFAAAPVVKITLPFWGEVGIGHAEYGLCGGMTYGCLDRFRAGVPMRDDVKTPPQPGTHLFDFLCQQQVKSLARLKAIKYLAYMTLPNASHIAHHVEWHSILARLEHGPLALGLVPKHSLHLSDLSSCHQVVGYSVEGNQINIYDPNHPGRDDLFLQVTSDGVKHPVSGYWLCVFPTE